MIYSVVQSNSSAVEVFVFDKTALTGAEEEGDAIGFSLDGSFQANIPDSVTGSPGDEWEDPAFNTYFADFLRKSEAYGPLVKWLDKTNLLSRVRLSGGGIAQGEDYDGLYISGGKADLTMLKSAIHGMVF